MPGPGLGPRGARGFLTEDEKANMPKVTWELIRRILSYLAPYWLQFLFVFVAILLSAVIGLYPSKKAVEAKLDSLFTEPWRGYEVENMTGFIGQYCHGNQPGHNIPYAYYFVGKQEKGQHYINMILDRFYDMGADKLAYAGMDDAGEMSSWYVWNAMGLYTYSPADPEYIVTVPLFDEVDFNLSNGKTLTIVKKGNGEKITSITYGGKKVKGWFVQDKDLQQGKTLVIKTK